jgi:hypothetical protein
MDGILRAGLAALAVGLGFVGNAPAGEGVWLWKHNCPPSSYPCSYFVAPVFWKFNANLHPPTAAYTYAPDRHPDIPLHYEAIVLPCPAVAPAPYPFPPAELPLPMTMAPPQPKAPE